MSIIESFHKNINFKKESYSLKWVVEHFDYMPFVSNHPVFGPVIPMGCNEWQVFMSKSLRDDEDLKSIGFRFVKMHDGGEWDLCEISVYLQSSDSKTKLQCIKGLRIGGDEDDPYVYCQTKEDLSKKANQPKNDISDSPCFSREDALNLEEIIASAPSQAELEAVLDSKDLVILIDITRTYLDDNLEGLDKTTAEEHIARDLKELLKSQKFADVVLKTKERNFYAHRNILSARGYRFDEMLKVKNGPLEKLELGIPDYVAEAMLEFIYTGDLPDDMEMEDYESLQNAADKYGVHNLRDACKKLLKDKFHIEIIQNGDQKKDTSNSVGARRESGEKKLSNVITVETVKEIFDRMKVEDVEPNKNAREEQFEASNEPTQNDIAIVSL